jgi:hypothetical protein
MNRRRRLLGVYARIAHVYRAWSRPLILLAVIVFIPLGLLDALLHSIDTSSLNVTNGFQVGALIAGTAAVTASSLFGEVFFSGAVAISLTQPEQKEPPTLRELARHISYLKLIAVDLLFVGFVAIGLFVLVIGAFAAFVYLSLAGAVVELEKHSVWGGFKRSFRLVRGHFWMVAAVIVPIEIVGDAINDGIVGLAHLGLGHGLLAAWLGEAIGNIITAPVFSVAVVLLTLDLIHHRDGGAPRLNPRPTAVAASGSA